MERYDFNIKSIYDAPKILENFNFNEIKIWNDNNPGFNSSCNRNDNHFTHGKVNDKKCLNIHTFKNTSSGLLRVYFKSRKTPFNQRYSNNDYKYTLDNMLKMELEIEKAYICWDTTVKLTEPNKY